MESRLTWKRDLDGATDVGLRDGVTVGDAICRLADIESILGDEYSIDHLRALVQDEQDGRLVVLPCKFCIGRKKPAAPQKRNRRKMN